MAMHVDKYTDSKRFSHHGTAITAFKFEAVNFLSYSIAVCINESGLEFALNGALLSAYVFLIARILLYGNYIACGKLKLAC